MPIERAEPSIMAMAESTVSQLRSTIFFSAISRIWSRVTRPTVPPLPGVCEPLSIFAAFLNDPDRR
jgi:hypothetical protein